MRLIETIKLIDGQCRNLEYHSRRAGFTIEHPEVQADHLQGVVKWRILYGDGLPTQSTMAHYNLPRITTLRTVEALQIDYHQKYEDRSQIEALMRLRGECDDIIIIRGGMVSDSSFCNLVFENSEGLFTPSTPLLAGTKRQMLLDRGIIAERDIAANEIINFHSVRLINAMIELEDNITIDLRNISQ